MSLAELTAAERHRRIAADLAAAAQRVTDWDGQTPVSGWVARDVVDHLVTWLPGLLSGGGVAFSATPPATDDPEAVWAVHTEAVQSLLDDPARASAPFSHPQAGTCTAGEAIDRFYTPDVFMHTWDLARASGHDPALEPAYCSRLLDGMRPMDAVLRASGQFGPAVEAPAGADPQTQLAAFIGRDPAWQPAARASGPSDPPSPHPSGA